MADYEAARQELVTRLADRYDLDAATLAAMRAVPRHEFVPADRRESAYADRPLPIGEGQTISAPHMVAVMTDRLALQRGITVLEIGTGCGYHAAVTAEVVGAEQVATVEYHASLAEDARETLAEQGYGAVAVGVGDGRDGWPAHAPYDRAYLTCAAEEFPSAVVDQVRHGGVLLGPIGRDRQHLVRAEKTDDGSLDRESHMAVRFVPLQ